MKKIIMNKVNEEIYHETLDNGLNIYIYKKEGFSKKGAYFVTKYGSCQNDFKPYDEDEIRSFPNGIAHFLEHKLFESDDNNKTFDKFQKYGADVNAFTNHVMTNYYFSTIDNFDECLNLLIDFVQSPYFTLENVEKEKPIINKEINMTDDNISRFIYTQDFKMTLINDPNKFETIGDKESVSKITKEDLYKCYNTFYHPSNMFLVIYGDVDVKKTIDLVKENQKKKEFGPKKEIVLKEFSEPKDVKEEYKEVKKNITEPRVSVCYKLKVEKTKEEKKLRQSYIMDMLLDLKLGGTSTFENELIKEDIIKSSINYTFSQSDDTVLFFITATTDKKDEFIKKLDEKIKEDKFDSYIFDLNKKAALASIVRSFDEPSSIGNVIFNNIIKYGRVINEVYDIYNDLSFEDFVLEFKKLDFSNKSILYLTSMED